MTESDNIFSARVGDDLVFRKIFDRYYPKVLGFLCSFLQSESDAEDVAQNVFVKLWMRRDDLFGMDGLDLYLFRMTINMAINFSKSRKHYTGMGNIDISETTEIEDVMDTKERLAIISKIVANLPEKRREVFMLSRFCHLTHKEIAAKLNISVKTVENHINFTLKELRKVRCVIAFFLAMVFG